MSLKKLTEQKVQVVTQMRELLDTIEAEGRALNAEENGAVASMEAELASIDDSIKLRNRTDELGRDMDKIESFRTMEHAVTSGNKDERSADVKRSNALRAWGLRGIGELSDTDRADIQAHGYRTDNLNMKAYGSAELRALSSQTGAAGGYTVADDNSFMGSLERALLDFGGMRDVSNVIRTAGGNPLPMPSANDTGNTGSYVAESATLPTPTDPTWDIHTFNAHKVSTGIIRVPYELLDDTSFDLEGYLAVISAERIARIGNTKFTVGDGAGEPLGITLSTTLGKTAAAAAAITSDELLDLKYSVDRAYRVNDFWMLADATLLALRKLKDGDGQYIWAPGMVAGEPDTLYAAPVVVNEDMPAMTTGLISVLYGAKDKYKIREVSNVLVQRLVELYAASGQVGFVTTMRNDGALLDAGTNPVKHLIQA